jgi:predicted metal-binding membrane protein
MADLTLEAIFKRDNTVVALTLLALMLLAWLALIAGAGTCMDPFAMSGWFLPAVPPVESEPWTHAYWLIALFMWTIMMVAMMLPSASPTVLLYGRVVRQAERNSQVVHAPGAVAAFAAGYLTLWSAFSVFAVALQWALEQSGAMTGMMALRQPAIAGTLLIAVGVYQLTPLKGNCLAHCRSPASFLAAHWRPGVGWRLAHGTFAWRLLRGVLLCPDADSLRGRRDELGMDRRLEPARARREAPAARRASSHACRSPADDCRCRSDRPRLRVAF